MYFSGELPTWQRLQEARRIKKGGIHGKRAKSARFLRLLFTSREAPIEVGQSVQDDAVDWPWRNHIAKKANLQEIPIKKKPKQKPSSHTQTVAYFRVSEPAQAPRPIRVHRAPQAPEISSEIADLETVESATQLVVAQLQKSMTRRIQGSMRVVDAFKRARSEMKDSIPPEVSFEEVKRRLLLIFMPVLLAKPISLDRAIWRGTQSPPKEGGAKKKDIAV